MFLGTTDEHLSRELSDIGFPEEALLIAEAQIYERDHGVAPGLLRKQRDFQSSR